MTCGCNQGKAKGFVWTSGDGSEVVEKRTEVEVKALVIRKGGSYVVKT